jgi:uncharacterized protein with gpF-like domain
MSETFKRIQWKQFDRKRWQFERWAQGVFRKALLATIRPITTADSAEQALQRVDYLDANAIEQAYLDVYGRVGSWFAVDAQKSLKSYGAVFQTKSDETVFDRFMRNWISLYGAERIRNVTETTIRRVKVKLQDGINRGDGIEVIAREMVRAGSGIADVKRARVIARTEIISASNKGSLEGAKDTGIPLKKEWLATRDNRTRIEHGEADGQAVLMDQDFIVMGEEMEYPGDPSGSAANVINCRCTQIYRPLV